MGSTSFNYYRFSISYLGGEIFSSFPGMLSALVLGFIKNTLRFTNFGVCGIRFCFDYLHGIDKHTSFYLFTAFFYFQIIFRLCFSI